MVCLVGDDVAGEERAGRGCDCDANRDDGIILKMNENRIHERSKRTF